MQVFRGHFVAGDKPKRRNREQCDRLQIPQHVVLQLVGDAAEHMRPHIAQVDGVAVGRRPHDPRDADGAVSAAHILDDHRLAERHAHALGKDSP
jgi:hypothetical protein